MIIVTGANGRLGRAIVEDLLDRVPAASLAHAFEETSQILIVSADTTGETAVRRHRTAIEAAKAAGTRRILYTSHVGVNPSSPFPPIPDHAATEKALRDSGVA